MKTVEDQIKEWYGTCSWSATTLADKDKESLLKVIKQIQLDAKRAGMTEAAEIARAMQESQYTCGNWIYKNILAVRDNKPL